MWFSNLQAYRLHLPSNLTAAVMEDALKKFPFQPCGNNDTLSQGWVSPRRNDQLVHTVNHQMLFCLCAEKKSVPPAMVKRVTAERAAEIERQQGFKPGRKQMKELSEQVTDELLPRAFPSMSKTMVWVDPVNGWMVVDSSSPSKADEVFKILLKSLESLPMESLRTTRSPTAAMTDWLASDEAPSGFTIDQDTELQASGEGKATVRYLRHTLEANEIQHHIAAGKHCTRLAMTWNDRISFVLTETLAIKRVTALDILKEKGQADAANEDERFDTDFTLMAGELSALLKSIVEALDGFEERTTAEPKTEEQPPSSSVGKEEELAAA